MVQIVESGNAFLPTDVEWLHALLLRIQSLTQTAQDPTSSPDNSRNSATPPAPPSLPADETIDDASLPILLNADDDGSLLREFITESREHLDNIEQGVLVLERWRRLEAVH